MEDVGYKGRVYRDKALKEKIKNDIKIMAYSLIRPDQTFVITKGEFDPYVYCKHETREFCPVGKKKKYQGYLKAIEGTEAPSGYVFYGDSETEVYCDLIHRLTEDGLYFPAII